MTNATSAGSNLGCLLVHGYGGNSFEMEGLASALAAAGFAARVVCLPGHGEGYEGFRHYGFSHWLGHAETELRAMLARHARVAVIGFSMGGTIALNLASRYPVAGVAALSAPVYVFTLWPWPGENLKFYGSFLVSQARRFLRLPEQKVVKNGETSRDIAPWKGYDGPVHFGHLVGMREGCANTRALLPRLAAPLLIMQDERDRLVNPNNAWAAARLASSGDTTVVLTRMRENVSRHHMITTHRETAVTVEEAVIRFCREKILDRSEKSCL